MGSEYPRTWTEHPFVWREGLGNDPSIYSEAEDFVSLAEWAFGPAGFPALQVLAFGDFSHQDQYERQQFLVRRKHQIPHPSRQGCVGSKRNGRDLNFWPAEPSDSLAWDSILIDGPEFLSACPESGLIDSPYDL